MVKEQQDRDARILDLIDVLNAAYEFVNLAEPLKMIESRQKAFEQLLKETNECAYFILEYVAGQDFGEPSRDSKMNSCLIIHQLHVQ